jgi:glycosyltransferase involved in cell wall biosynthesis
MEAFLDKAKPSRNVSFAPIRFLFVGRLDVYTKGLDMLLQAFALARPRVHREALLVLVGPEWNGCMSVLTNLIKAVRLEEHVNIAGIRMGSDLAEMFDQSHIYIHVSRHEGHPSAVTEALLWGKPAILTSTIGTTSYPEIAYLSHVLVVPPRVDDIANSMIRAMACIEELQRNACENRLKVGEFFSWNRAAREHINRYQEVSKERLGE